MCGIIGYIGKRPAVPILIDGLKKLEYRGYDSAGFCVQGNAQLHVLKCKGKVSELEKEILNHNLSSCMGIAHTRWATHGQPNKTNAHPHLDCTSSIAIVHNGIIENYSALKDLLIKEGHKIVSETDSEIVAHLIERFFKNMAVETAVVNCLKLLQGAYALLVINKNSEKIIAVKKSSPLVIGVGEGEMFLASDVSAILAYTKKIIYLEDGEIAEITKNGYSIKNSNGELVDKTISEIQWNIAQIEKRGFEHFMLKEIFEQPEALENTMRGRLKDGQIKLNITVDFSNVKRIIIIACGTSWHSALLAKYLIEKHVGLPVEVDYASEFRYRNPIIRADDLVIVISQSGETADTFAALKEAKNRGAKTLGIINVVGSTISREVDSGIYLHAGPEIGVASTKAFSCQVMALILLTLHLSGKPSEAILAELPKIPEKVKQVLAQSEKIKELAEKFKDAKNFLYLGRNVNFPVALEGALKLKEISYIHAEGYPAAEMKHGPIALVDSQMPVVFIAPEGFTHEKIISNMQEIKARGGNIIAIVNKDDSKVSELANYIIKVPETLEELSPILNVIPLQLLAYHIADLKGIDVDKPRNLAKSVTVE